MLTVSPTLTLTLTLTLTRSGSARPYAAWSIRSHCAPAGRKRRTRGSLLLRSRPLGRGPLRRSAYSEAEAEAEAEAEPGA